MLARQTYANQFVGHDDKVYNNNVLDSFGTPDCVEFRERIFSQYIKLAPALRAEYLSHAKDQSYEEANDRLQELDQSLTINGFNLFSDREATKQHALSQAEMCFKIVRDLEDEFNLSSCNDWDEEYLYSECSIHAEKCGISPPKPKSSSGSLIPSIKRLCCEKWWKRQLSKKQRATVESVARDLRQVHNNRATYCSNISLDLHRQQKSASREFLKSQIAVNEEGYEKTLAELSDLGVSNPAIRRLELIVRCKGYENVAKEIGHEAYFITLTAPSRFHRMTKITNKQGKAIKVVPNRKFDGSTPKDTQKYLCSTWAKISAKFNREGIRPYGFRVAEPHHDGTPHWHFLLFIEKENANAMISIFKRWALLDSPNEGGAAQRRIKVEKIKEGINPNTGREYSATGYIIKYICKNIDGHGINNKENSAIGKDWDGKDPIETAERIEAWARTNRIRQFQPIGGPSVTVWRELRRLSEQEGVVEQVRQAADTGDWAAFVKAMGGPNRPRDNYLARPTYAPSVKMDFETGEVSMVTHTRYGDEAKERVVGILIQGMSILSRTHFWHIKENEKIKKARQKIMDGIADILEEIQEQNQDVPVPWHMLQAKPAALDLFQ